MWLGLVPFLRQKRLRTALHIEPKWRGLSLAHLPEDEDWVCLKHVVFYFDRSHPVVFCINTVINSVNKHNIYWKSILKTLRHVSVHWTIIRPNIKTRYWYIQRVRTLWDPIVCALSEPKHVARFLILITNICCVIGRNNYCIMLCFKFHFQNGVINKV
jgi:hypothetical protein